MRNLSYKYKKLGLPFLDYLKFKRFSQGSRGVYKTKLFGNIVTVTSPYWFLHSLDELFIEQVYNFTSDNPAPYILDCGANYGLSIIYFKKLFPKCELVAFEPDNNLYKIMQQNVANYIDQNVKLVNAAVWKEDTTLEFSAEGSLGGTVTQLGTEQANRIVVNALALKPFLTERKIDFCKIDIEGSEYEVLNSCKDNLQNVDKLFIEYHSSPGKPQTLVEILEIVKSAGFRFYIKEAKNIMTYPFIENKTAGLGAYYDMQLNIFCYR